MYKSHSFFYLYYKITKGGREVDITQILQIVGSTLAVGITAATTLITTTKKLKKAKSTNEKMQVINEIVQKIPELITQAELTVGSGNGALKKTLVLQQLQLMCAEKGINSNEQKFNEKIEEILLTPQKKEELKNEKY